MNKFSCNMSRRYEHEERFRIGKLRSSRKSSNFSNDSTESTELEEGGSSISGHVNMNSSRRSVSLPRYSSTKLSPSLAAAMLSLPWPPPAKKINESQSRVEKPEEDDTEAEKEKVNASASHVKSKASSSRKFYRKKRSKQAVAVMSAMDKDNNNNNKEVKEDKEYVPVTIPKFNEVHTNWPGFEHEPVPNWQEKYMIAKPYPKRLDELPAEVLSKPSYGNHDTSTSDADEGLDGKSKTRIEKKGKASNESKKDRSKPRRRLYVERIGGCIK